MSCVARVARGSEFALRSLFLAFVIVVPTGWLVSTARATIETWTGNGGDGNWSNGGNWDVGKPLTGDSVFFPNSGQTNVRADFSAYPLTDPLAFDQPALDLQAITFAPDAPAYSIELYTAADPSPIYQAKITYDGAGVINSSGVMQNFVLDPGSIHGIANGQYIGGDASRLTFNNSALAGNNIMYHAHGGFVVIINAPVGYAFLRTEGSSIVFNNSASAGSATFIADGGAGNGVLGASVEFHNASTAASGNFTIDAGPLSGNAPGLFPPQICGFGGKTIFFDTADAGTAHFTNNGTAGPGGFGGVTIFTQNSSAANGTFVTNPTTDASRNGIPGGVGFFDSATADHGIFTNNDGPVPLSNGGTGFAGNSTAANAVIENLGGASTFGGTTTFYDHATAASSVINNRGLVSSDTGGLPSVTSFRNDSTAGTATIHNWPNQGAGGRTEFYDDSTAAAANIILEKGAVSDKGGTIVFNDNSSAGSAHLNAGVDGTNGTIIFNNQSTADHAVIALGSNNTNSLSLQFFGDASAGSATISVGTRANLLFYNNSTAETSAITMLDHSVLVFNGSVSGPPTTTAGSANIHLLGGAVVAFSEYSTAANAQILVEGASVSGGNAGILGFDSLADAGHATIFLNSSPFPGSPGGLLVFNGGASGPLARVVTRSGTLVYLVGNASLGGTALGSIEGDGEVSLGSSRLTVGALGSSTTFSGPITGSFDGVSNGSLVKVGPGRLTLAGANTYPGQTIVQAGELALTGSLMGDVDVKSGATFLGTGNVTHGLNCEDGSICKAGLSPGTLTVGGLNLMSGATLQYELGAGDVRDRIVVTNNGNITVGGLLDLSLLAGFNPALGQTFSLFEGSIGSITGTFSAVNAPIFNGHTLSLLYGANQVMLQVSDAILPPGDYNRDGIVDAADYTVWRDTLGSTTDLRANGDNSGGSAGKIDQSDYTFWKTNFGNHAGSGAGATAAVPEPASLWLLLTEALTILLYWLPIELSGYRTR